MINNIAKQFGFKVNDVLEAFVACNGNEAGMIEFLFMMLSEGQMLEKHLSEENRLQREQMIV